MATPDGHGYWIVFANCAVASYGDAPFLGSMAATVLNGLIVGASGY